MTDSRAYAYQDGLSSERLRTRFLVYEDHLAWKAFFADSQAMEFIPRAGLNSDADLAKFWMHKQLMRYQDQRYGLQAITDRSNGTLLGLCGLLKQEIGGREHIEVGYHFLKKYWGQGYAPEAARLFIDYAFSENIGDTVISIIHVNNLRSQRVAEKNGLKRDRIEKWNDADAYIYSIGKDEYLSRRKT